ncbi:hypothetical protein SLA2020_300870 [Shorea laevis]
MDKMGGDMYEKIKSEGGLGVRNLESFNKALLGKWKWRILREKKALWRKVIFELYGSVRKRGWEGCIQNEKGSVWWKELWKLERVDSINMEWIRDGFIRKVGEGKETLFWEEVWIGNVSLREKFPRLYSLATNKQATIAEVGRSRECEGKWGWEWRRTLFVWESTLLQELEEILSQVHLQQGREDCWVWKWESNGRYSTKSAYNQINQS